MVVNLFVNLFILHQVIILNDNDEILKEMKTFMPNAALDRCENLNRLKM